MPESEIVVSVEGLEQFLPKLRRFRQFGIEHLQRVRADLLETRENLERARYQTIRDIRQLESEIVQADEEDDTSALRWELDEARERRRRVEHALRNVSELTAIYEREAERLRRILEEQVPRSEALLTRKASELRVLHAIQLQNDSGGAGMSVQTTAAPPMEPLTENSLDFTSCPLPSGYRWVKLSDMDLAEALREVQTSSDFRPYATYDMLRGGLDTLCSTVLPAIAAHGYTADSYFFENLDKTTGRDPEQGARRAFESFFGDEAIVLQRSLDGSSLTVINGRHRIKTAQDAGWLAVPVRINRANIK